MYFVNRLVIISDFYLYLNEMKQIYILSVQFFSEFLKENMWLSLLIYSIYIYDCFYFLVVIKFLVD
jgi:hypothetical protein